MKSDGIQLLLTFLFGPLGLFYSSVGWAISLLLVDILLAVPTHGMIGVPIWIISMIVGFGTVETYNNRFMENVRKAVNNVTD